ncbi:hypothetical protein ACE6H2_011546 [Prunus campanulata]
MVSKEWMDFMKSNVDKLSKSGNRRLFQHVCVCMHIRLSSNISLIPLQEIKQDTWRIPKPEIIVSAPEIGRNSQSISYKIIKSQEHYYQVENNISRKTQMKEQSEL